MNALKRERSAWRVMRRRCLEFGFRDYPRYGGAGILICPQWQSFDRFIRDVGPAPSADSWLGRRDTAGHYVPENVIWTTQPEQERRRQFCRKINLDGQQLTIAEAERVVGLEDGTLRRRLNAGIPLSEALIREPRRTGRPPKRTETAPTITTNPKENHHE